MIPSFPFRHEDPAPGKRARVFFWSHAAQGYVAGSPAIVAAFDSNAFNHDDKIEFLTCKRIDMSDAEFAALPVVDACKISRRDK